MRGAAGDVVEHHGHAGRLDDLTEVCEHARLAGLVVVGRHEQQPVGAELLGLAGQLDGVRGGVGADAGDDRGPVADGVLDGAEQVAVLGHRGGRRLAGRAGDHDTVVAVVDEVGGDARGAVEVDRAVVVERARHRGQHPTERGSGRWGARGWRHVVRLSPSPYNSSSARPDQFALFPSAAAPDGPTIEVPSGATACEIRLSRSTVTPCDTLPRVARLSRANRPPAVRRVRRGGPAAVRHGHRCGRPRLGSRHALTGAAADPLRGRAEDSCPLAHPDAHPDAHAEPRRRPWSARRAPTPRTTATPTAFPRPPTATRRPSAPPAWATTAASTRASAPPGSPTASASATASPSPTGTPAATGVTPSTGRTWPSRWRSSPTSRRAPARSRGSSAATSPTSSRSTTTAASCSRR